MIRIFFNPLDAKSVVEYPIATGTKLINFLQSEYPVGFDGSLRVFVGNQELDLIDLDYEVQELDQITMLVMPSGGAFAVAAGKILITALVSAAIGYAINLIFAPKTPSFGDEPSESLVYTLNPTRNAIRLGEPISVSYGTVSAPPPYGSAPYSFYWEGSNDQYVDQLMVLGQGKFEEITVDDIFIGDTPLSAIADGSVRYWVFDSDFHQQQMGRIGDYITEQTSGGYAPWPFYENVYLSPEASDLNFEEQKNEEAGAVAISGIAYAGTATAPGRIEGVDSSLLISGGDTIVLSGTTSNNISFVVGSVAPNPDDNSEMTVWQQYNSTNLLVDEDPLSGTFTTNPADAGGDSPGMTHGPFRCQKLGTQVDRIDCDIVFPQGLFRVDGTSGKIKTNTMDLEFTYQQIDEVTGLPIGLPIVQTKSWLSKSRVALRATISSGKLTAGHYECTVRRITPMHDDSRKTDQVTWTGLKGNVTIDRNAKAYGDVSIICFRLLATNALGEAARSRIRVVTTRILDEGESNNPITAIKDIWTNKNYGLGFSPDLLDPAMDVLETFWADPLGPKFNGSYDTKSTGFDSMQSAASFAGAKVVNNGQLTNVVADGIQDVRHAMFSTANIVRDSLEIIYSFDTLGDYTGNSVSYRDPLTFDEQFVFSPEQTENPENFTLFGCTDKEYAQRMANYLWNVKTDRRQLIKFDTELEGLIPSFGQRIGVSSPMPDWGQSGVFVQMVDALTWIVDQPLEWTENNVIIIRGKTGLPSSPYTVTQGSSRNVVVFGEVPPIVDQQGQEPTNYAFGTSTQNMTDWIVTKISPKGDNIVGIEAQIYKPEVFVDVPCQMTAYAECVDCKVYECDAFSKQLSLTVDNHWPCDDIAAPLTDVVGGYDLPQVSSSPVLGIDPLLIDSCASATATRGAYSDLLDVQNIIGVNTGSFGGFYDQVSGSKSVCMALHIANGANIELLASGDDLIVAMPNFNSGGTVEITYAGANATLPNGDYPFIVVNFTVQASVQTTIDLYSNFVAWPQEVIPNNTPPVEGNNYIYISQSWINDTITTQHAYYNQLPLTAQEVSDLSDAYLQNQSTYVDPRPECTPCKVYECDSYLNAMLTEVNYLWTAFQDAFLNDPTYGDYIPNELNPTEIGEITQRFGTAGLGQGSLYDGCIGDDSITVSASQGLLSGSTSNGNPPNTFVNEAEGSIGGFYDPSATIFTWFFVYWGNASNHYLRLLPSAFSSDIQVEVAGSSVITLTFPNAFLGAANYAVNYSWAGSICSVELFVDWVSQGVQTADVVARNISGGYQLNYGPGNGNGGGRACMFFYHDSVISAPSVDNLRQAWLQNQSTYVDPRPECQ